MAQNKMQDNGSATYKIGSMLLILLVAPVANSQPPIQVSPQPIPSEKKPEAQRAWPPPIATNQPTVRGAFEPKSVQTIGHTEPDDSVRGDFPSPISAANYEKQAEKTGPAARVGAAGEMIGFSQSDASGSQTITLVHTGKSWIAVYHIDRSGQIRLVSSRPIDADFSLQLNATSPLPEEIREMAGKR